jgi:hypothetical protein
MNEDDQMLTVDEALIYIRQQFMEPDGLISHVELGEKTDMAQIEMVTRACNMLQTAWQGREVVPKEFVRMVRLAAIRLLSLEQSMSSYTQRLEEITQTVSWMQEWIEMVFLPPPQSEEAALALVCQHLLGTRPFTAELLMGRINEDSAGELVSGLQTLAQAWSTRDQISKLAAYAMLGISWDFDEATRHFSGNKLQRFHEVEQQVNEAITKCLS